MKLKDLKPEHFDRWFQAMITRGVSIGWAFTSVRMVRTILNFAVKRDYIYKNPAKSWTAPVKNQGRKAKIPRFLTFTEAALLLEHCKKQGQCVYEMVCFLIFTGLRPEELAFLTWDDIDLEKGLVHIQEKEGFHPKDYEIRTIDLSKDLIQMLKRMKRRHKRWVFPSPDGCRLNTANFYKRHFRKAVKAAGLNGKVTIYTCRHTLGSWLTLRWHNPFTVMKILGHSRLETVLIYTHLLPNQTSDAITSLPSLAEISKSVKKAMRA